MDRRRVQTLARLQGLAALKKDAELAKLAAVAQSRNRLAGALEALKRTEAPLDTQIGAPLDQAMIVARVAHRRWIEAQQRRLNQQLALVTADYLRQKPAAAKAFGRAAVLDSLTRTAELDRKAAQDKRAPPA